MQKQKTLSWNELSELGLLYRINKEILHPMGLAIMRDPSTGTSPGAIVSDDGVWIYSNEVNQTHSVPNEKLAAHMEEMLQLRKQHD